MNHSTEGTVPLGIDKSREWKEDGISRGDLGLCSNFCHQLGLPYLLLASFLHGQIWISWTGLVVFHNLLGRRNLYMKSCAKPNTYKQNQKFAAMLGEGVEISFVALEALDWLPTKHSFCFKTFPWFIQSLFSVG